MFNRQKILLLERVLSQMTVQLPSNFIFKAARRYSSRVFQHFPIYSICNNYKYSLDSYLLFFIHKVHLMQFSHQYQSLSTQLRFFLTFFQTDIGHDDVQSKQATAATFFLSFIVKSSSADRLAIILASHIFSRNNKSANPIILSLNLSQSNRLVSTPKPIFPPYESSNHTSSSCLSHLFLLRIHRESSNTSSSLPKNPNTLAHVKKVASNGKDINQCGYDCFVRLLLLVGQYQVEMSLSIFALRNEWYRNGIWWFTKMANRLIGESRYDAIRVQRRIFSNKFYYLRQHLLYRCYVESPDVANMIGIYPKTDSSHGYGNPISYEMYRDFQENTINSDGSFGMWTVAICAIYLGHAIYSYFMPWYWNKTASCKNGEEQRIRIRDALSSTIIEDTLGFQFLEWGFNPHYTYYVRHKLVEGHAHPDDVRAMACSGLTRKNRYVEHFSHIDNKRMIGPF